MSRFRVDSEVGQLRMVLVHRPELSIKRLTPSNCSQLLFDDVLRVEQAGQEHDVFTNVLKENGAEVLVLKDMLEETLDDKEAKQWLLDRQVSVHRFGETVAEEVRAYLSQMTDDNLAAHLIGGLTVQELGSELNHPYFASLSPVDFIIDPIPNHLFTRDTSCWVYGGVSVNPMAKQARQRETVNLRAIYKFHPLFKDQKFHTYFGDSDQYYDNATIEGGDVLVIGRGAVLIGMSERTTAQGVECLARGLFKAGQAKKVIALQLPKARSCMHLDTVFTQMDEDCFSYYPDIMSKNPCWEIEQADNGKLVFNRVKDDFIGSIKRALGLSELRMIPTGGDIFEAEREQWNDANNVLAVRPGVVITYERNVNTIKNMRDAGIEVLTIPGEDLGRGRGGARCMSCPVIRDGI